MKRFFTSKNLFIISAFIIAITMFVINYYTPYLADDYTWLQHTIWGTNKKMDSIHDFILSVYQFYFKWGGRVWGYIFIQIFTYLPPVIFDLLNTLCYMLVTFLIYLICKGKNRHNLTLYIGIHVLLWVCVPDYGQVMFWLCGSANYLWTSLPVLFLLYLYRKYTIHEGNWKLPPLYSIPAFLLSFFVGSAMENMSAGVLLIITLHLLYYYKNGYKIQLPLIASYIGSLAGFCVLLFAPGNRVRSAAEQLNLSMFFKFFVINYYWFTFVGIICIIWLVLAQIIKHLLPNNAKQIILESILYLIGAVAAAYCMLAAPSSPERTWYIVCVYGIISVGIFYSTLANCELLLVKKATQIITVGAMVLLLISMADTVLYSREISVQTAAREQYILEQKALGNLDIQTSVITHRYPLRSKHDALTGLSDITSDSTYWVNQTLASYYGVNSITGAANN